MTDHRLHPRYQVALSAELTHGVHTFAAATQDLSRGGIGVALTSPIDDGARVEVSIFLTQDGIEDPDVEPFETEAVIAWMAPSDDGTFKAGLRFGELSGAQQAQLDGFLAAISPA